MKTGRGLRLAFALAAGLPFAAVPPAAAANLQWTGAVDTSFTTGGNWLDGVAPANNKNDTAVFAGVPTGNQPVLNAGRNIAGVDFQTAGWELTGSGTLNINSVKSAGAGTNRLVRLKTDADAMMVEVGAGNRLVSFNGIQFRQRVRKRGSGVWEIAGSSVTDNVLDGRDSVTVEQGTLLVNGTFESGGTSNARSVTVSGGATIRGNGTLSFTPGGALFVNGILRPGDPAVNGGVGTLSVSSTATQGVTFGTNSRLVLELGATSDVLSVTGNLNLSASQTLELQVVTPPNGRSYTLVTYSGTRTGGFSTVTGIPDGYTLEYGPAQNGSIRLLGPPATVLKVR